MNIFTPQRLKIYVLTILVVLNSLIWYAVFAEERNGLLTIAFLDIGQGDAIFIESPMGNQLLIDGGKNSKVLQELGKVMPFYDRSIDVVIATHPDADHIGGLPYVLETYEVGAVFEPGVEGESGVSEEFEKIILEKKIKKLLARRDMKIDMGNDVFVEILFPDGDVTGFKTNNASIVARLVFGDFSVMLTGDSPVEVERQLVKSIPNYLDSDILKAGHHGSRTSTSEEFVKAVSPEYAIISAGKDNSYGHPHKEVMDILKGLNVLALGTYNEGTIVFVSDGINYFLKN